MPRHPLPQSFADIRRLIRECTGADLDALGAVADRNAQLTKPPGSLGRLEEIAGWMAAWQSRRRPKLERPLVLVFAGDHGVAARGVSAYPSAVTAQMVAAFRAGKAAINQLCRVAGADLDVHDFTQLGPTADFTERPALDEEACVEAFRRGMAAVAEDADLVCPGEMGIGNTTAAAAICRALFDGSAADWAGPGTGLDPAGIRHKAEIVEAAVERHGEALRDPLEALRRLGGYELAAICGAVLAARLGRQPVLLDGYVSTAAAAALYALDESALDHCLVAHVSAEPGHRRLAERIGQVPLLDLDMHLGEASGAALAINLVRAAVETHNGMATFAEAGVSDRA